jgi:hypothetical protein
MSSSGGGLIFKLAGGLLILFGIIDFVLYQFFNFDVTGVSWSPVAAGIVGSIIMRMGD